ncbi:ATP synthase F0 subunit B [Candidatus Daviesbacteria bacterium RIFCSPLOWO2_01_FULL_39_12]|uniref:ATP synthase subunit b n=1 Tax=Candidatus Daviesbacteria bacterium RIFCSPLOWO2_01_FULL_39_12 TaxID=1797785 RepID=A0A1F5KMB9_9BACT|nr:MAG: ATP synthase F0 subunit B [Candidatus Daviesbacteria bacterium RIFCSPHIGHO2_02_FULL_39_8]OGE41980.1 MAG: ATP synthase F0 subunit B [Candidatus Daviesbacteria bacterium RIFCSPLOWO2_01_FULL_39_12]
MDILNQFGVQPILLAAQVVNFFILLFILKKLLYGPILKVLEARRKKIEESLKNAEEIEKKLQETDEQSEKIIANTLQQSQKILDETKEAAAQILEDANNSAANIIERAHVQALEAIKTERIILERETKEHLGDLVVLAFEKVTGKKVTREDQERMIEKEVRNLS